MGHGLLTCKKMKGQLVHLQTRIDSFILPWSSKLFCMGQFTTAALRFWASSAIKAWLDLKSPINKQSISRCQSTLIASKCDHLDRSRVMLLLGFLGSWGVIFVLATIRMVDCTFHCISLHPSCFHSCVWEPPFYFCLDGAERHHFFDCYCMCVSSLCNRLTRFILPYLHVHVHVQS